MLHLRWQISECNAEHFFACPSGILQNAPLGFGAFHEGWRAADGTERGTATTSEGAAPVTAPTSMCHKSEL